MSRAFKFILLTFFLMAQLNVKLIAWAEATGAEETIVRSAVEYSSNKLRDPFKSYFVKEEPKPIIQETVEAPKPKFDTGKLSLQGTIRGAKVSQAIINNKVLKIGDLIEGAEIVSIEKKGVTLSYNGEVFDLTAPGEDSVKKEEK